MVADLKSGTERLVLEEIQKGHFSSVDEIIQSGVRTLWFEASAISRVPRLWLTFN